MSTKWLHPGLKKLWMIVFLAITVLVVQSCRPAVPTPPPGPRPGQGMPPRIDVPGPQIDKLQPISGLMKPELLPKGARAVLPAYDGDSFFVTLPVSEQSDVTAKATLEEVIQPILGA